MTRYAEGLSDAYQFPQIHSSCSPNHWLCTARTPDRGRLGGEATATRDPNQALWAPMHTLSMHHDTLFLTERDHVTALFDRALSLPSSVSLQPSQQTKIIELLNGQS